MDTGLYGVSNRLFAGDINADIVITGSSRAASHYDPRIIQQVTGHSAFNIGRNGSQTDMQLAVLKAYLNHNAKPQVVIHNLDAYTFQTTREVYDPAQYVPYLNDPEIFSTLQQINPNIWKSRYLPLYGYVVEDMRFAWMLGVSGFFGVHPREDHFLGFDPRWTKWTDEFNRFKAQNPQGVDWQIETAGLQLLENLADVCQAKGISLMLVYSPEYSEMQRLTRNRSKVFEHFHELASRRGITFWDFSNWHYAANTELFTNSQHLNAQGATVFSRELALRMLDNIQLYKHRADAQL